MVSLNFSVIHKYVDEFPILVSFKNRGLLPLFDFSLEHQYPLDHVAGMLLFFACIFVSRAY